MTHGIEGKSAARISALLFVSSRCSGSTRVHSMSLLQLSQSLQQAVLD
jgi:hypothetical protein